MIVLFTDFGLAGPYVGQMTAVLYREAPGVPVVNLIADAPAFNPGAGAHLLAAYAREFPPETVFLCVVDPGVGTAQRRPVVVRADGRWLVGPDNGLLHVIAARAQQRERWEILWRPGRLSASFHGRDLFAPVAASLANGELPRSRELPWRPEDLAAWAGDLAEIIYVDAYGNAMTGIRARNLSRGDSVELNDRRLMFARTFGDVEPGQGLWYENANGLAEIAVNAGSAAERFDLRVGSPITVIRGTGQ